VGQLRNTVAMASPWTKVKLLVYRDGRKKTLTVKIGELSDSIAQAETSDLSEKLGMSLQEMNEDVRRFYGDSEDKGVIVSRIVQGSHAEMAGIRPGNIILSVNKKEVKSLKDVNNALRESVKTKKVLLLIKAERFTRFVVIPFE
jgi:serine protease Do